MGVPPRQRAKARRVARRIAAACALVIAGGPAVADTLDLAGANVTLPKAPFFVNSFLSGAADVTNSGATGAILSEGGGTAATAIYTGVIKDGVGSVGLTHTSGVTVLSGANTYSGPTLVQGGTLQAGSNTGFSANSAFTVNTGATLDVNGFVPTVRSLSGGGLVTNNGAAAGVLIVMQGGSFSGNLQDGAGQFNLSFVGGSLTLSGVNTHSGYTSIGNAGTLRVGSATALSANSTIYVNGALDLNGFNAFVPILYGGGVVTNNGSSASTLTVTQGGYYNGTFQDGTKPVALSLDAPGGTLVLGSVPYYGGGSASGNTGVTTIANGTLQIGDSWNGWIGTLGTGAIVNNGVLAFNQAIDIAGGGLPGKDFGNDISGTGSVQQYGQGTVTLSGTNTYSGGTIVDSSFAGGVSQLLFASESAAPATGDINLYNRGVTGTTYAIDQTFLNKVVADPSTGVVALGADSGNALSFDNSRLQYASLGAAASGCDANIFCQTFTYSGALTPYGASSGYGGTYLVGGGNAILNIATALGDTPASYSGNSLRAVQNGYTILSGVNTYTGGTTIESGTLQFQSQDAIPNAGVNRSILIQPYAVAAAGYAMDQTFLDSIRTDSQGTAALAAYSANNLDFSALPTVSLGATQSVTFEGTIKPYMDPGSSVATYNIGGGIGNTNQSVPTLTIATPLTDRPDAEATNLLVNPAGYTLPIDVVLIGEHTYSGVTQIDQGALYLGNGAVQGTIGNTSNVVNYGALVFNEPNALTFDKVISGSGNLIQIGPGTVTLTGANTYTGATLVFEGTLAMGAGGSIASSAYVYMNPGTTFDISNGGDQTISGVVDFGGTQITLGANRLTFGSPGNNYPAPYLFAGYPAGFRGVISGTGGVTFAGADTYTLYGQNTYSGSTIIQSGTLRGGIENAFSPNSRVSIAPGAVLDLGGFNQVIAALGDERPPTGGEGKVTNNGAAPATLNIGPNGDSGNFSGTIEDGVSQLFLRKIGSGTQTLSGSSTYTGATKVLGGVLAGGANNAFSPNSAFIIGPDGVLALKGTTQVIGSLSGEGVVGNYSANSGSIAVGKDGTSTEFSGLITDGAGYYGSLALVKQGAGVFSVTGTNDFTGGTTIQRGTILVSNPLALGSGAVKMNEGTTLAFDGTFTFDNPVNFLPGVADPTIDSGAGVITMSSPISGAGDLTKIGSGTLILTAASTYSGNTFVNVGTLQVDGSIASSPTTTVASGAALTGIGTVGGISVLSGGFVAPGNPGNLYAPLNATGPIALAAGSNFVVNVSVPTTSLLTTTGAATLGGNVLINLAAGTYNPSTKYPILTATGPGGVTGTFAGATILNNTGYHGVLSYDAQNAYLQIVPNGGSPLNDFSSFQSVQTLLNQRTSMMINNRVLGAILGGFNEQINCASCMSGFGALGSFSVGFHGRKALNDQLSLLGGFAYVAETRGGVSASPAPMFAAALRYDMTELGKSRPYFEGGGVATPGQRMSYKRDYANAGAAVYGQGQTTASNYSIYGKIGWVYRFSERDEASANVELSRSWQLVGGYVEAPSLINPQPAVMRRGIDRMNIAKASAQWIHLFGSTVETQINLGVARSFGTTTGQITDYSMGLGLGLYKGQPREATWLEYGLRVGYRLQKNIVLDVFTDGTLGAKPVGNSVHGGMAVRYLF